MTAFELKQKVKDYYDSRIVKHLDELQATSGVLAIDLIVDKVKLLKQQREDNLNLLDYLMRE